MTYEIVTNSGELYHHGIKGQQWGKQNGPPYPLRETVHDKIVKNAKTDTGKKYAEFGKTSAIARTLVRAGIETPQAVALVSSIAATNPPLAVVAAAAGIGAEYVTYKLDAMSSAWTLSKIGDAVERHKANKEIKNNNNDDDDDAPLLGKTTDPDGAIRLTATNKSSILNQAKNEGKYSIDFLEAVQNSKILNDGNSKALLTEYSKYLDNPDKYWREDRYKLKDI